MSSIQEQIIKQFIFAPVQFSGTLVRLDWLLLVHVRYLFSRPPLQIKYFPFICQEMPQICVLLLRSRSSNKSNFCKFMLIKINLHDPNKPNRDKRTKLFAPGAMNSQSEYCVLKNTNIAPLFASPNVLDQSADLSADWCCVCIAHIRCVASNFTDALKCNSKAMSEASKRVRQAQQQMEVRSDEVRAG